MRLVVNGRKETKSNITRSRRMKTPSLCFMKRARSAYASQIPPMNTKLTM
jgi:hypothetical protein